MFKTVNIFSVKTLFVLLCVSFLFLGLAKMVNAADTTATVFVAASPLCADIQTAINSASVGGVVNVPAGSATWSGTGCIKITKPISIIGAGIGKTIITDNTVSSVSTSTPPISISFSSSIDALVRISGFEFHEGNPSRYASWGVIQGGITGTGTNRYIRVDHNSFIDTARRCLFMSHSKGLVDHNYFYTCSNIFSSEGDPDAEWQKSLHLGSDDAWYMEDNVFNYSSGFPNIVDCQYGARMVLRYNSWIASGNMSGEFTMNHGYDSVSRGCMNMEVYNNTFKNQQSTYLAWAVQYRGGTGVVFNNTLTGKYTTPMGITNYRSNAGYTNEVGYYVGGTRDGKACYVGGYGGTCVFTLCDGTARFDGNTPGGFGYPCRDQIGRGGNQELIPLYEWNNTLNGSPVNFTVYNNIAGDASKLFTYHILANRDFYNGVANSAYTPYIYPHPLIASSGAVTTYIITASSGGNGNISPSGAVLVNDGLSQTFTITPNSGYHIDTITVDGSSVSADSPYTFTVITANHSISATFSAETPPADIIGDFNHDGLVNSIDLSMMVTAWNTNNSTYDLNHDGIVNSLDYVIMVQNWSV
jgi:hypothetical protein